MFDISTRTGVKVERLIIHRKKESAKWAQFGVANGNHVRPHMRQNDLRRSQLPSKHRSIHIKRNAKR
jgi:hypothetical protein